MKATCPNCQKAHLVPEGIDPKKEQTLCPKCGTKFTFKPKQNQASTRQKPGISAIRAQSGSQAAEKLNSNKGFRVRTNRGLVYDFPSLDALKRWLSDRDKPEDCQVSAHGAEYRPAAEVIDSVSIQEAINKAGDTLDPSQPIFFADQPTAGDERQDDSKSEMDFNRRNQAGWVTGSLGIIGLLLLVLGVAITLTRYGVVDLSSIWPLDLLGIQYPAEQQVDDQSANQAPKMPTNQNLEDRYNQALAYGKRALRDKRFSKAALEFNRALSVHPGSLAALEGLAKAYNGLGDREKALAIIKRAQSIKGQTNSEKGRDR